MQNLFRREAMKCLMMVSLIATLSGCATDIGSKSYSDEDVGEVSQTFEGTVLKVRSVKVGPDKLSKNHTGAVAGGLTGGLLGSQVTDGLGGVFVTAGAAGVGALGGAMAEKSLNTQQGLEITVRLESGSLKTVVQGDDVPFQKGERILLVVYERGRSKVVKENDET